MAVANKNLAAALCILSFACFAIAATSLDVGSDVEILRKFISGIEDPFGYLSSWTSSNASPCMEPLVFGIQLENMGLSGRLNLDVLTSLPLLRTISFMNNNFSGPLPDLKNFQGLKNVFFSMNRFEGEIPNDAFDGMQALKKVNLSTNGFTGRIPSSLARVSSLSGLWLDDNGFVGEIPDFEQTSLVAFNVSNNNLEGRIPDKLSKLDPSNFSGNKNLCGPPTKLQCQR